jgi:hypothetical protein
MAHGQTSAADIAFQVIDFVHVFQYLTVLSGVGARKGQIKGLKE